MINKGYVLVEDVIEGVYQDMGIQTIQWNDALRWVGRVLAVIGLPNFYMEKVTNGNGGNLPPIVIENYRGELPGDFVASIMARTFDSKVPLFLTTGVFEDYYDSCENYKSTVVCEKPELIDAIYNNPTDSNTWYNCKSDWFNSLNWWYTAKGYYGQFSRDSLLLSYRLEGGFIHTNFKDGLIELAYTAFPVDKDFRPLIPNDDKTKRAVETFLMERIAHKMYHKMRDNPTLQYWKSMQQEYAWAVASARSNANAPNMEQMEVIANNWMRLIPDTRAYETGHKYNNVDERRRH